MTPASFVSPPAVNVHLSHMRYYKCRLDLHVDVEVEVKVEVDIVVGVVVIVGVGVVVGADVDELLLKKTKHIIYKRKRDEILRPYPICFIPSKISCWWPNEVIPISFRSVRFISLRISKVISFLLNTSL